MESIFRPEMINFKGERFVLNVDSSMLVYSGVNKEILAKELVGKNFEEVEIIINNYSEIEEFELKYRPFWIKAMPREDKIKITIKIEGYR